jgi:hypothetical protein
MTFERIDQVAARVISKLTEAHAKGDNRDIPELDDRIGKSELEARTEVYNYRSYVRSKNKLNAVTKQS